MFKDIADFLVYKILKFSPQGQWDDVLHFFIYDLFKISFLLFIVIFFMGVISSYLPVEKVRGYLENRKFFGLENLLASLLGALTPFCSCSSIPLFIGFLRGGIPLGVTLSFLITSPLINEVAVVLFLTIFGWKITLIYILSGLFIGTVVGFILGKLHLERYLEGWLQEQLKKKMDALNLADNRTLKERWPEIKGEALGTLKRVLPYVAGGVAIGALIHGLVPTNYFEQYMGKENLFAVPISTLLAVPMYSNASGVIPVIQSLISKGIPLGTAIAFMMAVVGLSLPEAILLKKVMQTKLIAIYFSTVAVSIIIMGYFFNLVF